MILDRNMTIHTQENDSSKIINSLRFKFKKIPHIFYLNLNQRIDKKDYVEKQFQLLEIQNFTRVSANRFSVDDFNSWRNKIIGDPLNEIPRLSTLLNQFQVIVDWYDSNISDHCIIAEDDVNFLTAKYWTIYLGIFYF